MLAAILTGVLVTLIGSRFGFRRPLYAGYAVLLGSVLLFMAGQPVERFAWVACLFGVAWNLIAPYQFEAVIRVDSSTSAAMLVNAGTFGGLAVGPAIASYLVTPTYVQVNGFAIICIAVSLALAILSLKARGISNVATI